MKGSKNPFWKGGRSITSEGYVIVRRPGHPMADVRGYVYEHRLVASETLGRLLHPLEHVHHRNHVKDDNRPENLKVLPHRHHQFEHRVVQSNRRLPDEPNLFIACACDCGEVLMEFDNSGRRRRFISGHNMTKRRRKAA